eukprot:g6522.t1
MASTNAEHDDAYYEKLLARVDNTISDSRTRDRGDLPMNLQISNDHSISGVFFYFEGDALSLPHRFSLMLLSIVYVMFFSLCTAGTETRTKGFAGSWFLITLTWQPLNTLLRRVLRRPRYSQKNYIWPYGMVAAIVFTGIVDLVILTKYGAEIELEFDYLTPSFIIFLTTWTTNWLVEIPIIYYVITNDMDMSKSDEFITSNQDIDSIVGTTSNTLGGGDDGTITNL